MAIVSATENPYDRVPYATQPNRHARPDRLAAIGTLYGLQPAGASRCRVLENWNTRTGASCDEAWFEARLADVARLALLCG